MIIQMSVFSWISSILTLLCFVWLIGLGVFVIVRKIIFTVKAKKEIKKDEQKRKETVK